MWSPGYRRYRKYISAVCGEGRLHSSTIWAIVWEENVCQPLSAWAHNHKSYSSLFYEETQSSSGRERSGDIFSQENAQFSFKEALSKPQSWFQNWGGFGNYFLTNICVKVRSAGCHFLQLDLWNDTTANEGRVRITHSTGLARVWDRRCLSALQHLCS